MQNPNKSTAFWRIGAAALVVSSIIGTYFLSGPRNRKKRDEVFEEIQEELDQNLTTPANATFPLVWSVIYAGNIGLAIHQALPAQQSNPRYQKAVPWLAGCYGLNALFGYFFSSGKKMNRVLAGLNTISTLPPALVLHQQLEIGKTPVEGPENILRKSVSLYAGWLTAASVVSTSTLFIQAGYRVSRVQAAQWAYAVLTGTGTLGLIVSRRLNDPYYLAPLVAAFLGIAAKQYGRQNGVAALASALALALSADLGMQLRKEKAMEAPGQEDQLPQGAAASQNEAHLEKPDPIGENFPPQGSPMSY